MKYTAKPIRLNALLNLPYIKFSSRHTVTLLTVLSVLVSMKLPNQQ